MIDLARDGSVAHRLARRANALLLLDGGISCEAVAKVLFMDDDTVRNWYRLYQEDGIEGLTSFGHEGGSCRLTVAQQETLKTWITAALPRTTHEVGAWIAREYGVALRANDCETQTDREFTLEGRGHSIRWLCAF